MDCIVILFSVFFVLFFYYVCFSQITGKPTACPSTGLTLCHHPCLIHVEPKPALSLSLPEVEIILLRSKEQNAN
jgi:hypothetical protein